MDQESSSVESLPYMTLLLLGQIGEGQNNPAIHLDISHRNVFSFTYQFQ